MYAAFLRSEYVMSHLTSFPAIPFSLLLRLAAWYFSLKSEEDLPRSYASSTDMPCS